MSVALRHNVHVSGPALGQPMMFAHGFGCDQNMWRHVAPRFEDTFKVVLFDHVGAGGSDLGAFDPDRYASLGAYADDVLDICHELDLQDVVFVGHSVSAMIGVLAATKEPARFASWCWWARRLATSTTATTSEASAGATSTNCSN